MPLPAPPIDARAFDDLVTGLVARIPVHTPEWTNFSAADPGITLVQLFAHITESLLYRANQIPERNRAKFLSLLGVGLNPAREAHGIVAFANDRGPVEQALLPAGTALAAGTVAFETTTSLDALPVEGRLFVKRPVAAPSQALTEYYDLLYASYGQPVPQTLTLYESVGLAAGSAIDFAATVDRTLWIALLANTPPEAPVAGQKPWPALRAALAGRTLSLGLVPDNGVDTLRLGPGAPATIDGGLLGFALPNAGPIALDANGQPAPGYTELTARAAFDPLTQPGIVELTLPAADGLTTWDDLDPLEAGVGDLPPMIDDNAVAARIVTWLRVAASGSVAVRLRWAGINAASVRQVVRVSAERLADGDGTPGQMRRLGRAPVLPASVAITGIDAGGSAQRDWRAIDDILAAGPEVPIASGGSGRAATPGPTEVFTLDPEAGIVRFGDGLTGRRPPPGEALYASYDYCEGEEGNVGAGALRGGPLLPAGMTVTNPLPTWGGADAESIAAGEKQVPRILQHRDRLVTAADFRAIAWRTPGAAIGRIDVLPACHPDVVPVAIGTAPGTVTLLAIPANDPAFPHAPRADRQFLNALCRYLEPRRLVTTEVVLRGAAYVGIWISVGIEIAGGSGTAETVAAVKARLQAFLSPLPRPGVGPGALIPPLFGPEPDAGLGGWPLGRAVHARTLLAEAARTPGVVAVADVLLARGNAGADESIPITGLELPEILGISVVAGDPLPLDVLRGTAPPVAGIRRLPVPVVAETC